MNTELNFDRIKLLFLWIFLFRSSVKFLQLLHLEGEEVSQIQTTISTLIIIIINFFSISTHCIFKKKTVCTNKLNFHYSTEKKIIIIHIFLWNLIKIFIIQTSLWSQKKVHKEVCPFKSTYSIFLVLWFFYQTMILFHCCCLNNWNNRYSFPPTKQKKSKVSRFVIGKTPVICNRYAVFFWLLFTLILKNFRHP